MKAVRACLDCAMHACCAWHHDGHHDAARCCRQTCCASACDRARDCRVFSTCVYLCYATDCGCVPLACWLKRRRAPRCTFRAPCSSVHLTTEKLWSDAQSRPMHGPKLMRAKTQDRRVNGSVGLTSSDARWLFQLAQKGSDVRTSRGVLQGHFVQDSGMTKILAGLHLRISATLPPDTRIGGGCLGICRYFDKAFTLLSIKFRIGNPPLSHYRMCSHHEIVKNQNCPTAAA